MLRFSSLSGTFLFIAVLLLRADAFPSVLLHGSGVNNGIYSVPAVRKQNHQPNGALDYVRALSKWSARLPGDFARIAAVTNGIGT
jgi:hypothetical protein